MKRYVHNTVEVDSSLVDIQAMSRVGVFAGNLCMVTPDDGRMGEPYFKVCNNASYRKADEISRISFLEPRYITGHRDESGKKSVKLSSKQIKQLVEFFSHKFVFLNVSHWQFALYQYNKEFKFIVERSGRTDLRPVELSMFLNGEFDTEENLAHPNYLPSYLQMPDYSKLR